MSLRWDNSHTSQRTHGNTLVSCYAVSSLMWIHLFPSCFPAEVRGRPCLGRRSAASSQSTNADKLKVPFRCLPFCRKQLYNVPLNSDRPGDTAGNTLLDTVSKQQCFFSLILKVNQTLIFTGTSRAADENTGLIQGRAFHHLSRKEETCCNWIQLFIITRVAELHVI